MLADFVKISHIVIIILGIHFMSDSPSTGNDTIDFSDDSSTVNTLEGDDFINVYSDDSTIIGGEGNDTINILSEYANGAGDAKNNVIQGGGGDDTIVIHTAETGDERTNIIDLEDAGVNVGNDVVYRNPAIADQGVIIPDSDEGRIEFSRPFNEDGVEDSYVFDVGDRFDSWETLEANIDYIPTQYRGSDGELYDSYRAVITLDDNGTPNDPSDDQTITIHNVPEDGLTPDDFLSNGEGLPDEPPVIPGPDPDPTPDPEPTPQTNTGHEVSPLAYAFAVPLVAAVAGRSFYKGYRKDAQEKINHAIAESYETGLNQYAKLNGFANKADLIANEQEWQKSVRYLKGETDGIDRIINEQTAEEIADAQLSFKKNAGTIGSLTGGLSGAGIAVGVIGVVGIGALTGGVAIGVGAAIAVGGALIGSAIGKKLFKSSSERASAKMVHQAFNSTDNELGIDEHEAIKERELVQQEAHNGISSPETYDAKEQNSNVKSESWVNKSSVNKSAGIIR